MKVLTWLVWGSAKFWLGAIVIVAAALAVARDAAPANAANTEILPSLSSGSPTWASTAILLAGGGSLADNTPCVPGDNDPTTLCLYIWAKDVSDPIGASAFQVHYTYADDRITVGALTGVRTWLASTGHSVICSTTLHPGDDIVSCETLAPNSGWVTTGSGMLATVAVSSKSVPGTTTLDLSNGTFLVQGDPNSLTRIPAAVRSISLFVAPCADFTGDGTVRSVDILYVAQRYHLPDPGADLDGSGLVTTTDMLITAKEYNWSCHR